MFGRKVARLMEWVAMVGCPIIGINDSAGARIQDAVTSLAWYAELGRRHELAARSGAGDLHHPRQMRRGSGVFADPDRPRRGGARPGLHVRHRPDVIKDVTGEDVTLDELGGADAQARYGNIHQVVEDEAAAFQYVRDYLAFCQPTPLTIRRSSTAGRRSRRTTELDSIVPDADNMAYDMHEILLRIFDDGDVFDVAQQQVRR